MHIFFFFNIVAFISTVDRDESVQQYLADLDNMHKERCKSMQQTRIYLDIQVVLEVPGEKELRAVAEKLSEAGIQVSQQFFKTITLLSLHHMSFLSTSCGWNNQKTSPRVWRPSPVRKRLNVWLVLYKAPILTPRKCRNTSKSSNSTRVRSLRENLLLAVKNEHHL